MKKNKNKNEIIEMASDSIIEVKDLCKSYKTNKITVQALTNINLTMKKGEFIAIVGPSGSGKTTLINCLGALDYPDSGQIIYNINNNGGGQDITKMDHEDQKNMRLNKIGLIFQFYNLFPVITAYENVELPMLIAKKKIQDRKKRVKVLLDLVGLSERMEHFPTQMSGGEQQRVTVARALINQPLIIIADEPTGELDTETTLQIIKIFLQIKQAGHSILMVTHNMRIAYAADRILTLVDGKISAEILGGKPIEELYDDDVGGI
ncbi:MAG: ABC transporter ATP-binding protein [Promethearchaeota archaeon]